MKATTSKSAPIGYIDLSRGKIVAYGTKEHRDVQKERRSAARKTAAPRTPTPLAELKAYAKKVGAFEIAGTYMKVDIEDVSLIVDSEEPYFAENQLMAYVQTGDLEPFIEVAKGVYLDADFEDMADEILSLFGISAS